MALTVNTSDPLGLLDQIKAAIDAGEIRTWAYNLKGEFTHTPPQWHRQAWLKPTVGDSFLQFEVRIPLGVTKRDVEGIYQGRFSSMLQNHFHYTAVVSSTEQQQAAKGKRGGQMAGRQSPASRARSRPNPNRRKQRGDK